jgi:alpha-D-ribose 1-methylphosphonate 5-triphosphate diphosphatase
MTTNIITNINAVLPDSVIEDARVVIEDGVITEVGPRNGQAQGNVDGLGAFCIPGVVDTHSDGFEAEPKPRPGAELPLEFCIRSFEAKVRAAGITTIFHGIGFENDGNRSVELANRLVNIIHSYSDDSTLLDNRVLYRLDARDADGFQGLLDRIDGDRVRDHRPLVSFEDHTPGVGQYRDRTYFENWIMRHRNMDRETARAHVDEVIKERDAVLHNRAAAIPWLTEQAIAGTIRLMAHDPATPEDVEEAISWHASIAEFPTTIEAAELARNAGMRTVCGAPNVLRGGSHTGNVSAAELISLGLCDGLSSDYLPFAMLGAVGTLVRDNVCSIVDAVRLVTSGPAETVGLQDRGRLVVGARGDVTLCHLDGSNPRVLGSFRTGQGSQRSLAYQDA